MVDNINTQLQNQNTSNQIDTDLIDKICHPDLSVSACQYRIQDYLNATVAAPSNGQSQSQVISVAPATAPAGDDVAPWETPVTVGVTITTILSLIVLGVKISYRFVPEPEAQPQWQGLPRKFAELPKQSGSVHVGINTDPQLPQSQTATYAHQPGPQTQLGAIPTTASESSPDPFAGPFATNDPAELIASFDQDGHIRNWFICGVPGSGKGTLMSTAVAKFLNKFPQAEFWLIDPKNDPAEDHLWSFVPKNRQLRFDANHPRMNPDQMAQGIKSFGIKFYDSPTRPRILIVDEMPAISAVSPKNFAAWFRTFLSNIASMGRSRQYAAWISTQAIGVTDNGLTVTAKSCFYQIYLANGQTYRKIVTHPSFQRSGLNAQVPPNLVENNGRVYLTDIDNKWGQVPHYEPGKTLTNPMAAGNIYANNAVQAVTDQVNGYVHNLQQPSAPKQFSDLSEFLATNSHLLPITQSEIGNRCSHSLRKLCSELGPDAWFDYLQLAANLGIISLNWPYVDLPKK